MHLLDTIFNSLFPPRCLGCKKNISNQDEILCEACRKTITLPDTLFCGVCGSRLPMQKKVCHKNTPYLLGSVALYGNPVIKKMILALKFRRMKVVGSFLGKLLAEYAKNLNPLPDILRDQNTVVIPLPLSRERLRERGFNQTAVIARSFAEKLKLPYQENIILRTKHTLAQSQSENTKIREDNVAGAFSVIDGNSIKNKKIILVDDVTTTGATLKSATLTLKKNGATEILALTIAR